MTWSDPNSNPLGDLLQAYDDAAEDYRSGAAQRRADAAGKALREDQERVLRRVGLMPEQPERGSV